MILVLLFIGLKNVISIRHLQGSPKKKRHELSGINYF